MRIGVCGAGGKMGRRIVSAILRDKNARLAFAFAPPDDDNLQVDAGLLAGEDACGVKLQSQNAAAIAAADVMIDFSSPSGCARSATLCAQNKTALVVGVTGLSPTQLAGLKKAARNVAVVFSPNMSAGVNALFALAAAAAKMLADFDMEVMEAHHRHKKDAPSGTALKLGEIMAQASGGTLARRAVFDRRGKDNIRRAKDIGFAVVRGGDIIGEHRLIFAGAGEQVELTHRSQSRDTYAAGAVRAAKWAAKAKPGFYDMTPVLAAQTN
ncbi:MAG: 4-hydroxy-tetrahydrodipicolinate reductase [Gammaproteobacteria bacterium]